MFRNEENYNYVDDDVLIVKFSIQKMFKSLVK